MRSSPTTTWWTSTSTAPSGIIGYLGRPGADGEYALDLLMIAKYFERIGDHATNIAGWVAFSILGHHVGE